MSTLQHRSDSKTKALYDPLAVLDEDGSAEPLDEQEQEAVIKALREANEKANYFYRGCMLIILGLTGILYLSPLPDYVQGTHPESHLTLFFGPSHLDGHPDDLVRLPALPIYVALLAIQGTFLFAAFYETLNRMGYTRVKGVAFPQQPHLFGTAPNWIAPLLSEIRFNSNTINVRADTKEAAAPPIWVRLPPRILYLCILTLASFPMPLMTFGTGNFVNAGWWAISTVVLMVLVTCEVMIHRFEVESMGLNGLRYGYKGA